MEKEMHEQPVFKTIRQTAALGILPENTLRRMEKQGKLPGFHHGNRFLVNVTALSKYLDAISTEHFGGEKHADQR